MQLQWDIFTSKIPGHAFLKKQIIYDEAHYQKSIQIICLHFNFWKQWLKYSSDIRISLRHKNQSWFAFCNLRKHQHLPRMLLNVSSVLFPASPIASFSSQNYKGELHQLHCRLFEVFSNVYHKFPFFSDSTISTFDPAPFPFSSPRNIS